ncbi:MAG TPA: response regulator [Candidatus Saccharimonadales bacterium]|nr:response regulator [Candidatus Saccharimonadales bacterium]
MTAAKILVVEDEHSIADIYQFKLSNHGYEVQCAFNGLEGLEQAESFQPDLILLDLRMPHMSGDEMLQKLRETDWGSSIRVIILTNISREEAPSSLRLLHVDRYIVKAHHTPAQVLQIVQEVLGTPEAATAK